MKIFILEDNEERIKWFVKSFSEDELVISNMASLSIEILKTIKFQLIFLDHDLGGKAFVNSDREDTGAEVAREMRNSMNSDTPVVIHSLNKHGAQRIESTLMMDGHQAAVRIAPYGSFKPCRTGKGVEDVR